MVHSGYRKGSCSAGPLTEKIANPEKTSADQNERIAKPEKLIKSMVDKK
jgi:hypothetical protein